MNKSPTVLAISSHVVRGSVGLRATVFALESLGHSVWSLPTIMMPWHPGHGAATRTVEDEAIFSAVIEDMIASPYLDEVDGIITGYFGAAYQVPLVAKLINHIKAKRGDVKYLCDPVIGDGDALYVDEAIANAIKSELLPLADIMTPNRFELAWLSGQSKMDAFEGNNEIIQAARSLNPKLALITSAFAMMRGNIGNLMINDTTALLAEHRHIGQVPNGLGDLTAALAFARLLRGQTEAKALEKSTASVFEISHRSAKLGANELLLQQNRDSLVHPMAQVLVRNCI